MSLSLQAVFVAVALVLAPTSALAHGEEALVTLGVQILAIGACIAASVVFIGAKGYRALAILGGLLGGVASWQITGDWPYLTNQIEITAIHVGLPILGTLVVLLVAKVLNGKQGTGSP